MRRVLVGSLFFAAVGPLLVATTPRAEATLQFTVTSVAFDSAFAGLVNKDNQPLAPPDSKRSANPQNFQEFDDVLRTKVEGDFGVAGHLKSATDVTQTTTVMQNGESVTVDSDASMSVTSPVNRLLPSSFSIGNSGGSGQATFTVTIVANQSVAYSINATSSVTPAFHGVATVQFSASDGTEGQAHSEIFDRGFGTSKTSASFSKDGRLDLKSPASSVGVSINCLIEGGIGSATTHLGTQQHHWHLHLTVGPASADGDTVRWINRRGGSYDATDNWDVHRVPQDDNSTHNDTALFDLPGAYTVDVGGAASAAVAPRDGAVKPMERLIVDRGSPTFVNSALAPDSPSESEPAVLVKPGGTMTVKDALLTSKYSLIGAGISPHAATVVVTGANGRWENGETMKIGAFVAGRLVIDECGFVGSKTTLVGSRGSRATDQTTEVDVKHTGSTWQPGHLQLGVGGAPGGIVSVRVTDGGSVTADDCLAGFNAQAVLGVHGSALGVASNWAVTGVLGLGMGQPAHLEVRDGAAVNAATVFVPFINGSGDCGILVSGEDSAAPHLPSSLTTGALTVGGVASSRGAVTIVGGGTVSVLGAVDVGGTGGRGVVDIQGASNEGTPSLLTASGDLTLGGGVPRFGVGELTILDGGKATCQNAHVGVIGEGTGHATISGNAAGVASDWHVLGNLAIDVGDVRLVDGQLHVDGDLTGNGTLGGRGRVIVGGAVLYDGRIEPGNSPGTLTIEGDVVLGADAVIDAEVAGPDDLSDHLIVTGNATLNGTLLLHFMNGFAPKTGDHFEVMNVAGATTSDFAAVQVEGLEAGAQFQIGQTGSSYVVTATNDAKPLTTISAKAGKRLKERAKGPAFVTLTRSGKPTSALTVNFVLEGTAEAGVDYAPIPGTVTFPAKKRSVKIPIRPIDDYLLEGDETVKLSVVPGVGYSRSLAPSVQITLVDDEK